MAGALSGRRMAVIGATGFIGSHLTEHLIRSGARVLAVAHTTRRLANLAAVAKDCRFALGDIHVRETICPALADFKPEVVFHLAADVDAEESFPHIAASVRSNAAGALNAIEAAWAAGAGLFVYADSCKVYGNGPVPYRESQPDAPVCSYAIAKAAGWRICLLVSKMTGMAVCGLRSTFVYGPRQNPNLVTHVWDCVRRGAPVELLGGAQTRDLLYVEDIARAYAAAACEPEAWGHAVPVGGGSERTVASLCREIVRAAGGDVEVIEGARQPRLTEIWRSYCDNADAGRLLRWAPRVSLQEGLARTFEAAAGG